MSALVSLFHLAGGVQAAVRPTEENNAPLPNLPEGFSLGHALALMHVRLAIDTVCELDERESQTLSEKLLEWDFIEDHMACFQEALAMWGHMPTREVLELNLNSALYMKEQLPIEVRRAIFADLTAIAKADGKIVAGEASVLLVMQHALGID